MDSGIFLVYMRDGSDILGLINILVLVLKGNHAYQNVRKNVVMQKYENHASDNLMVGVQIYIIISA